MRKCIAFLALVSLAAISCKKATSFRKDAEIIGYDASECECCGGYMVRMADGASSKVYLTHSFPKGSGINKDYPFPASVEIDYKMSEGDCDNYIDISRLRHK